MRMRMAFLSCAVVAAAGLLAPQAVAAADLLPYCTTPNGVWKVSLTSPPSVATPPNGSGVSCPSGSCVAATYKVEGITPDHVAGLMPLELRGVTGENLSGIQDDYYPGQGDPIFGLGLGDVSRVVFKVNPSMNVSSYTVWLDGQSFSLGLVPVKIKKGSKGNAIEGACALAGPTVAEVAPNSYQTVSDYTEEVLGGKCKVKATRNLQTGDWDVQVIGAVNGNHTCTATRIEFENVNIAVTDAGGNQTTEPLQFSEGFEFVAGTGTCAYKQYYPNTGPVYRVCWQ